VPEKRAASSHVLRRLTLGSGPLKRTSDRLQFLGRVLLAFSLVMAIPPALAVATVTHSQGRAEAAVQALERRQVRAMLQGDAVAEYDAAGNALGSARAVVVWTAPAGTERTGTVDVPLDAKAGSTVPVWMDRHGDLSRPPVGEGDVIARTIGNALLTYLCIAALVCAGYYGFRKALDRSRLRRWARDWVAVEPVWRREIF
jgi:hypothetical protein